MGGSNERWLPVAGYRGIYEVSDWGRVRSLERQVKTCGGALRRVPARVLRLAPDRFGHMRVGLHREGRQQQLYVHRLVLEAFVGTCPDGMEACHGDGDPANNRLEFLRWDTPAANQADRLRHGTHIRGERHKLSKLTEAEVLAIRVDSRPHRKVATDYGVSHAAVSLIKRRKNWGWLEGPSDASPVTHPA